MAAPNPFESFNPQFNNLKAQKVGAKTLSGHTNTVYCLAIALSGELVSGSSDDTIKAWDLKSGQCLKTLSGHPSSVCCLAIAPSGELVSGSADTTIKVWDLKSGQCLKTLSGHIRAVRCLAIAPSGELVSGSRDKTIKVWDLRSGKCLKTLEGHTDAVDCLAIAESGELVSGSDDNTIKVWDLKSGQCLKTLSGHTSSVTCLALTQSGELISGSQDTTIKVWDLKSGKCLKTLSGHTYSVDCLAIAQSGELVSGSGDDTIKMWDLKSGKCLKTLGGHTSYVSQITILPSGELVSGSGDKTIKVWDSSEFIAEDKLAQKQEVGSALPLPKVENVASAPAQPLVLTKPIAIPAPTPIKAPEKPSFAVSYTLNYQQLTFGRELGKGGFGIVHQGIWRHNDVAIKQLLINNLSTEASDEFKAESAIMARLHSPNIVQLYGCCFSPQYCIVMEYMPKGSLYSVLHSNQELTWSNRIRIAVDMARGVAFLHQEHILHRDIKSLNVLLGESFNAKLADFGLSKVKTETQSTSTSKGSAGTLAWMAPELATSDNGCTKQSDIYSLGITFWELASREIPFKKVAKPALIPMRASQGVRDEIPADCPAKLASLIKACWETDPDKRPEPMRLPRFYIPTQKTLINSCLI